MDLYLWLLLNYMPAIVIFVCGALIVWLSVKQARGLAPLLPLVERLVWGVEGCARALQPSARRAASQTSLADWYFSTPEGRAGRVGAHMETGELLILWLTDEQGRRLMLDADNFKLRGGLALLNARDMAHLTEWHFYPTLPTFELAMGWKKKPDEEPQPPAPALALVEDPED